MNNSATGNAKTVIVWMIVLLVMVTAGIVHFASKNDAMDISPNVPVQTMAETSASSATTTDSASSASSTVPMPVSSIE